MVTFVLGLDNPKEEFSPGQNIAGRVHCLLSDSKYMEVKIRLIGEESTYYTERTDKKPTKECYNTNRFFLDTKKTIGLGHFDEGEYKFSFKQTLPTNIPSTYVGLHGHVKYFIKAYMISKCKEVENDMMEIKVFAPINYQDLKRLSLVPTTHSEDFAMTRWFCIPESISMYVELEKTFLVLGETTNITVELANNSSEAVSGVSVGVYSRVEAKVSFAKYLPTQQLLIKGEGLGVRPYQKKTFFSKLEIPEEAQIPNLQLCKLLTHKTILEVEAVLENPSKGNLKMEVELILGYPTTPAPTRKKGTFKTKEPTAALPRTYGDQSIEISKSGSPSIPSLKMPHPSSRSSSTKSSYEKLHDGSNPTPPYPTGSKSDIRFKAEVPMPEPSKSPPYLPKEENFPCPPGDCLPYPEEDNQISPPYFTATSCGCLTENCAKTHSISFNPPYPKEEPQLSDLPRSGGRPPYPTTPVISEKMPIPLKPTDMIEKDVSHLQSDVQAPYPTTDHTNLNAEYTSPKFGNIAPYPPEKHHATVGFANFIPMPMPFDKSSMPCGLIGFAVPMPNLPPSMPPLESQFQPSAPLLSDLKTPPIAQIEEVGLEDLLFMDTDKDVRDVEDRKLKSFHLSCDEPPITPKKEKKVKKREMLL